MQMKNLLIQLSILILQLIVSRMMSLINLSQLHLRAEEEVKKMIIQNLVVGT